MYANCVIYRDPDDPGHTVRLMPGIPESPVRQARAPYVVHAWNGVYLDSRGAPAVSERDSYIPLECFTGAGEEPSPEDSRASRTRFLGLDFGNAGGCGCSGTMVVEQKTGCGMLHGGCNQDV